jgi:hypothetical protein
MQAQNQGSLFDEVAEQRSLKLLKKLPYDFHYQYECATADGVMACKHKLVDWEAGALYWNCLRSENGDEPRALAKVRQKYFDTFLKTDLHFFLGTTQQFHFVAPNPWVIVGVFPVPHERQLGLGLS